MIRLETIGLAIVALYVLVRAREQSHPVHFQARMALLAVAAWAAEETAIKFYGFYHYSPSWNLMLDRVPLLVVCVWPVVIHSAMDLAGQVVGRGSRFLPLAAAGLILTDAALIEPVFVHGGLWTWTRPGWFQVPLIGILGWAWFGLTASWFHHRFGWTGRLNASSPAVLVLPGIGTHLLLLASWWGGIRWLTVPISPQSATIAAWILSLIVLMIILHTRPGRRIQRRALLLRLPAAVFLFAYFAVNFESAPWLLAYGLAFVPPYLALMAQQYLKPHRGCA